MRQCVAWLAAIMPGVLVAAGLALTAKLLARWVGTSLLGFAKSPISPIMLAILLGLLLRNGVGLPSICEQGLRLCTKTILRLGIVLLGLRLSLVAVGQIGLAALPIILACIATALLVVTWFNRLLGLPRRLGSLIAVGTSICGVSAIVATAPVIDADEDETSYAVGCVTAFGLMALLFYPFLAFWLFAGDTQQAGLFLGTAIHDTSQVAGAGLIFQERYGAPEALNTAAVTKLVRNLCMIGVIPLVAVLYRRRGAAAPAQQTPKWYALVPLFVLGFVAMAVLRSVGDHFFGAASGQTWRGFLSEAAGAAKWCLAIAMAAVGLGTSLARLKALGWKPFCVGFVAALLVGCVSACLVGAPWAATT